MEPDPENPFSAREAWFVSRVSRAGGAPVLHEDIWLDPARFPDLDRHSLAGRSLSRLVEEQYHLRPESADQTFRVARAGAQRAASLRCAASHPLLLVKRYAFDLELLAVSASLGYGRIRELPVALDYRFTGSGVGSRAVLRALVDTAAIFYRLRILRTYARKRRLLAAEGHVRSLELRPLVSLVTADRDAAERLDYPRVEVVASTAAAPQAETSW